MSATVGPDPTFYVWGVDAPVEALTLDRLRDPDTGARLAPVRADNDAVVGLPEGQTAPLLALVDTGLDSSHPWIAETLVDSVDLTGQGEEDRNGHGTWAALTALSVAPMPTGLLNIKALGDDGTGTVDALARGIRWAVRRGATSIRVSAGVRQPWCQADCLLCQAALAAAAGGAQVTAAAGNEAGEPTCPAKAGLFHPGSGVTAVGSISETGAPAPYSATANYYGVDLVPMLLPVLPPGGESADLDPKYRQASASTLLGLAVSAASAGFVDYAFRSFDQVVARWGDDSEPEVRAYAGRALLDKGVFFHRSGRLQDELGCYISIIERYGNDSAEVIRDLVGAARVKRAPILERLGDTAGALADYGKVIGDIQPLTGVTLNESTAGALLGRGMLLRTLGRGMEAEADLSTARDWYENAAKAGQRDAMFSLGVLFEDSEPETARHWYEKAAHAGRPEAMFNLGVMMLANSEPETARGWFEKAAQANHPAGMNNLGALLANSEPETARGWYEKAARTGHPSAMFNLGLLLQDSEPETARNWYEQGALAGHAGAMTNFAVMIWDTDAEAARHWMEKAAQAGEPAAVRILGSRQQNRRR